MIAEGGDVDRATAIVGGSTAGLLTAYQLALAGAKVALFEQASSLERTPRTLIVTSRMLDVLGLSRSAG